MELFEIIFPLIFVTFFVIFFTAIFLSIFRATRTSRNVRNVSSKTSAFIPKVVSDLSDHNDPHGKQVTYSHAYSQKSHDSGIKDKPLTEAERNVLYGK